MARIVYGVNGHNNGHTSRALSVAELLAGHEVLFAGGGTSIALREHGYAHEPLPLPAALPLRNNSYQAIATGLDYIRAVAGEKKQVRRLAEIITAFDPDLILTDYEFFTPRAARLLNRPCLSLDHYHIVYRSKPAAIPGKALTRFLCATACRCYIPKLAGYMMVSFHAEPLLDPARDTIFKPLPRADVLKITPVRGEHALVYLPGCELERFYPHFGHRELRIYGQGQQPDRHKRIFREPGREQFLEDLASAAYVISYGGHGLLTEALYLGKPCLCFPSGLQYERSWNSFFIRQKGYGQYHPDFDVPPGFIRDFESSLDAYARRIALGDFDGREALKAHLGVLLRA